MKRNILFFFVAAGWMISAQTHAQKVASVTIGSSVTEYTSLAAAVSYAEQKGEGVIKLLGAYSATAYPQAWVTDCTIAGPTGFEGKVRSFYTFHAFNPNNDDERIGQARAAGKLSAQTDIDRFSAILKEVDPTFKSTGVDIPNFRLSLLDGYADWHADFEVYFDDSIKAEDYTIAGNYGDYGWITEDQQGTPLSTDMKPYETVRLVKAIDQNLKYWELLDKVRLFHCGIISLNNKKTAGKTYTVNLYLYKEGNEKIKILVKTVSYTFKASGLTSVTSHQTAAKQIVNGQLVIVNNGKMYNAIGAAL